MKTFLKYFVLLTCCSMSNTQQKSMNLNGPYLGQKPPGMTLEIFAPGIISTDAHEFSCCFSPDSNEFYFTRMNPEDSQNYIMCTKWCEPVELKLGMDAGQPYVSYDGKFLFFTSGDPRIG